MTRIVTLAAVAALWSCAAASDRPAAFSAGDDARFTLAPGEAARAAGGRLRVAFEDVVSDSRCPTGEQCIVAGVAEIAVRIGTDAPGDSYRLYTEGKEPRAVTHAGQVVTLISVEPYPKASRTIPKGDYRATFDVRPE
jgi:hypothetical protein